jgi:hypothetical protein
LKEINVPKLGSIVCRITRLVVRALKWKIWVNLVHEIENVSGAARKPEVKKMTTRRVPYVERTPTIQ